MAEQRIDIKGEISPLRSEILESEKSRMEFLKWKLIAVAAIGTIGLGFGKPDGNPLIEPAYVLCIIPLVCVYVDLLCYHNQIRILFIAKFLSYMGDPYEEYIAVLDTACHQHVQEKIKEEGIRYFFNIEDLALRYSSVVLSLLIVVLGIVISKLMLVFLIVGCSGILLSFLLKIYYDTRCKELDDLQIKKSQ